MINLRHFHFKMLPRKHSINVLHVDSFFYAYYFVIITRLQLYRANISSRATIGPPAKCLISNIIGAKSVQAQTVCIQIKLQVLSKIVSNIRKYHNYKPKTNLWHREEEPHNHHETPGRQTKQSNQLPLPHYDDWKTRMDIKPGLKPPPPRATWYQNRLFPACVK